MIRIRRNSLLARLFLAIGLPLVVALTAGIVGVVTIERVLSAIYWQDHTREILIAADQLTIRQQAMESAYRAQLLLGAGVWGEEFRRAREGLTATQGQLRQLVDDPSRVIFVDKIANAQQQWLVETEPAFSRKVGALQGAGLPSDAESQLLRSTALSTEIKTLLKQFSDEETTLLRERSEIARKLSRQGLLALAAGSILALGLALVVSALIARTIADPVQQLSQAVSDLQGGDLSLVSPAGPDEIAELGRSFNVFGLALYERLTDLRNTEDRYRRFLGATAQLFWIADAKGKFAPDSPTWREFTGQSVEEYLGDGAFNAIHPDDRDWIRDQWDKAVRNETPFRAEYRLRRHDGEYRLMEAQGVPIRDVGGAVMEWVGSSRDVTERRRQRELKRQKEAAEAASRAKSEFLARMSHELRTPLNAVIGMSKMLATRRFGDLTEKQAEYVRDIVGSGEHLLRVINDILDLSKIEAGRLELSNESFDIVSTAAEVVSTLRTLAESQGIQLQFAPPPIGRVVICDRGKIRQVLYNLLSNAIKFTPSGGIVKIALSFRDGLSPHARAVDAENAVAFRVDVVDTGIGISANDMEMIWNEFQQAAQAPDRAREGTGLGLPLSKKLVQLMRGTIGAESELGKGSHFSICIPCDASEATAPAV